ncbi:glycosyltransferase [Xylophilus ampelinus]|nr:nucleotide disphospho-sugar-binding domain-containing protein [Xylophilus ampelinus]MCS4511040.1 hypothetical protein [Xylophilus ampelinus]
MIEMHGSTPVWVVPPSYLHAQAVRDSGCEVHAGPLVQRSPPNRTARVDSFADILLQLGFADRQALETHVEAWMALIARIRPDRIVLDYAPAAQLAALFLRIASFQITNGFDAPPPECPVFGFSVRGPYIESKNAKAIETLASNLAALKGLSFDKKAKSLAEYFSYPRKIYDCIQEADPYSPRTDGIYVGPLVASIEKSKAQQDPWSDTPLPSKKHKIFAYLRGIPDPSELLAAICACEADVVCVWPDLPDDELIGHCTACVRVFRDPLDMHQAIKIADAVINYGSAATVNKTLLMGKPQLMIPNDMEKIIISQKVAKRGAGIVHNKKIPYREEIMALINSQALLKSAVDISKNYDEEHFLIKRKEFLVELTAGKMKNSIWN